MAGEAKIDTCRRLLSGHPKVVMAPMINSSELAFRMLCRTTGNVHVCFTPMVFGKRWATDHQYRRDVVRDMNPCRCRQCSKSMSDLHNKHVMEQQSQSVSTANECDIPKALIEGEPSHGEPPHGEIHDGTEIGKGEQCLQECIKHRDRPLVVQVCGDDLQVLLRIAKDVEFYELADAMDINLGCPTPLADMGNFGAFLCERDPARVIGIIEHLNTNLATLPITCKMRKLRAGVDATIALAREFEQAGCCMLTVHGRTREQPTKSSADHGCIAAVKAALTIPVISNGGVTALSDVDKCLKLTQCDAVMVGELLLSHPEIFHENSDPLVMPSMSGTLGHGIASCQTMLRYIDWVRKHPPPMFYAVISHIHSALWAHICPDKRGWKWGWFSSLPPHTTGSANTKTKESQHSTEPVTKVPPPLRFHIHRDLKCRLETVETSHDIEECNAIVTELLRRLQNDESAPAKAAKVN